MSSSSSKRPNLLAWIGLLIVVVIAASAGNLFFGNSRLPGGQTVTGSIGKVGPINRDASDMTGVMAVPSYESAPQMAPVPSAAGSAGMPKDSAAPAQRVIKTGELSLRVEDAPKALEDARAIVGSKNGFVESSSISDSGTGPRTAWLTLRVPVAAFDATLNELRSRSLVVLNESVHGQDVTAEFIDIEADLRNAKAEEESYLEIMKRAGKIEEVLQVARALASVRGRIEQLEGRKRYMENRTDLATITATLTEETRIEVPGRTWKPFEVLRQAVNDLVISLQDLANFLIRAIIGIVGLLLPVLLIVAFVLWVLWRIYRAVVRRINVK